MRMSIWRMSIWMGRRIPAALDDLRRDLRHALRMMRGNPGSTAVVALSLGLGIGANTAMFSLVDVLLLRDLPVARPHELMEVGRITPYGRGSFSYPIYERIRDQSSTFSGVLAISATTVEATLDGAGGPSTSAAAPTLGRFVSGNFFTLLGLTPAAGRLLSPDDDRPDAAGGSTLAVIGHGLWQRRFGGSPTVVGRTLQIDAVPFTIVGVLPPGFDGLLVGRPVDFLIPLASEPRLRPKSSLTHPDINWLAVVGRLNSRVAPEAAASDVSLIFGRFLDDYSATFAGDPDTQRRIRSQRVLLESARTGLSQLRRELSTPVLLLMGAVSLVLLIACANVVNLLLARGVARRREIALRLAIGAGRGRIVRQLLAESLALGLLGGAVGLVLAGWGTRLIAALVADGSPSTVLDITPDGRILLFTAVVSLGSALLAGMAPAIRAGRTDVAPSMHGGARAAHVSRATTRWNRTLTAAQVALSLLLLVGASLLVATVRNLRDMDAGFEPDRVLLVDFTPGKAGYTGARRAEYYRQVLERVRNTPGVAEASLSFVTPIAGGGMDLPFAVEGRPREAGAMVYVNEVSAGYFATMSTRMRVGRDFTTQDTPASPPVAVINEALARRYFKDDSPIGQRVQLGDGKGLEVVGVVANAKYLSLREEDHPTIYVNALQNADPSGLTLSARTSGDPSAFAQLLRREIQGVAAAVPVSEPTLLATQIDRSLRRERLVAQVLGAFAGLALLLAAVGLYGVLAYAVTRRTGEIGIRMALGATRGAVLRSVLRESWLLVAIGVALGAPAALGLTRLLGSLLYGVTPADPWVLGSAISCLFLVALAAASVPAWRASRVDPLVALRQE